MSIWKIGLQASAAVEFDHAMLLPLFGSAFSDFA
jgi:hypothetical protein